MTLPTNAPNAISLHIVRLPSAHSVQVCMTKSEQGASEYEMVKDADNRTMVREKIDATECEGRVDATKKLNDSLTHEAHKSVAHKLRVTDHP